MQTFLFSCANKCRKSDIKVGNNPYEILSNNDKENNKSLIEIIKKLRKNEDIVILIKKKEIAKE